MAYTTSKRTNLLQNQDDFQIVLATQPSLFTKGFLIKTLEPIQVNKTQPRTWTIQCTNYK